jgi:Peptidase C39 family
VKTQDRQVLRQRLRLWRKCICIHRSLVLFLLAKFLGVPADPEQIAHDRGRGDDPYSLEDLSRIAKKLGLISRLRNAGAEELRKVPLPALMHTVDGDAVILLKIEEDSVNPRYLIQRGDAEWTCNGFVPVTYLITPPWLRMRAG